MIALPIASELELVAREAAMRDERINALLEAAEFIHSTVYMDGTRADQWRLKKPLGKLAVGATVSLRELHELLFHP